MPSEAEEPQRDIYHSAYQEENHRIMNDVFHDCLYVYGWEICMDNFSGVLEWYGSNDIEYLIYATPHYNEENVVPVDIIDSDDNYHHIGELIVPHFDFIEAAEEWYEKEYPKLVKDLITRSRYSFLFN